jgi:ADP-ribose pyrophosphatase
MSWKKLKSTILLQHPRMTIVEDNVELPNGHRTKYIYQVGGHDAVTVIAMRDSSLLIQQEYSYPPDQTMYQFPGGGIEQNEQPEEAALRELKEESGYTGTPTYLGFYFPNNRRSSNKMHVILVDNVTECTKEGGDAEEFITSEWVSRDTLHTMITEGKIVNYSILAGITLYEARSRQ